MNHPGSHAPSRMVSIGELLWDLLPQGPQLGGAPANVACHAAALGAHAAVISRVGPDPLGQRALEMLRARGLDTRAIEVDALAPTGTVHVEVDPSGHPRFDIVRDVAWDRLEASEVALGLVAGADAVCFGTLAQRTPSAQAAVVRLLRSARPGTLRVLDINLRPPFHQDGVIESSLRSADVLKLNEDELPVLARQFQLQGGPEEQVRGLATRFGLQAVALTLGARGACLLPSPGGPWLAMPGRSVEVLDAVGAGDAFTAVLILGLLGGWSPTDILRRAIDVAAFVCTQPGATPVLPASPWDAREKFRERL